MARFRHLLALALATAVLAAETADATPATLISVGHESRHLTASWSLPPGFSNYALVTGISAAPDPFFGLVAGPYSWRWDVASGNLSTTQTSFTAPYEQAPNTYYVRVGTCATGISFCGPSDLEWSNTMSVVIPGDAPPPAPPPPPTPPPSTPTPPPSGTQPTTPEPEPTAPEDDFEASAKCKKAGRFRGRTSQGRKICFNVTKNGTVKGAQFELRSRPCTGIFYIYEKDRPDELGFFSVTSSVAEVEGRFVSKRKVKGTATGRFSGCPGGRKTVRFTATRG